MVYPSIPFVGIGPVVAVGFPTALAARDLVLAEEDRQKIRLENFDTGFEAYQTIQELEKSVSAVLVFLPTMEEEDYLLVRKLKLEENNNIWMIPVIGIAPSGYSFDSAALLDLGFDDIYTETKDHAAILQRILFLKQYKPVLQTAKVAPPQDSGFKIPLTKRIFDIVGASMIILAISPILLLIALAVKLESRGPIIYRSKRVGTAYQVFDFLKFRSMKINADEEVEKLRKKSQYNDDVFFKMKNDPRITRVGRLIRKTSLDELPQLFNVLFGDMSLVGNRPLPLYEAQQLTRDDWAKRFLAPAGMTGLWQVTKRGSDDMSTEERIGLDINYANNYSLRYDIGILLRTLPAMIQKENV